MAILQIPVRNDIPSYDLQVDLDGVLFNLGFNYNARGDYWIMDISDSSDTPILMGIKLIAGWLLTERFVNSNKPLGSFFIFDTSGKNEDPTIEDFGTTKLLMYSEAE